MRRWNAVRTTSRRSRISRRSAAGAPVAAGLLVFATLIQLAVGTSSIAPHETRGPPPPPLPNHPYFLPVEPNGGENWTPGTREKFRWDWVHDPDPVHVMDLQLSLVGCLGDQDKSFYTVVKGHRSDLKNGQQEVKEFLLDVETPNTHQACGRILYTSPNAPGQGIGNDSFTIWNVSRPLAQIDLSLEPNNAQIPSGASVPLTAKVGLRYRDLWFPIWLANVTMDVSAGNLTVNKTRSGLEGLAKFTYNAPKVTAETNVTVKVCAEEPRYRPACFTGQLTIIPPGKRVIFLDIQWEPSPPHGGTKNNVSVTVRNVTDTLPGALVTLSSSDPQAKFDPVTGSANETGVFNSTWEPPDVKNETEFTVRARAVFAGYPEGLHDFPVTVVPRPIPKMSVVPFLETNGVLDSGTARMRVVVTDSKGFLPGAFVNVVDAKGATFDPVSSGDTDDRGEFTTDLRPPKLAENDTVRSLAVKINVTEPSHQPVETFLYVDVYRDPGLLVRPSGGYYAAVGLLLGAALLLSAFGFLRRRGPPGGKKDLQADGGEDEAAPAANDPPKGESGGASETEEKSKPAEGSSPATDSPPAKSVGDRKRPAMRASTSFPTPQLIPMIGIMLALVALGFSTPAGENALVDAGMRETVGSPPPKFNPISEVAVVSTEVGIAVIEVARFNRPVAMIHTGFGGHDLEYDAVRDIVYVSHTKDGTVSAVDVRKFDILATMSVGRAPRHIALSEDGSRLWSVNDGDPSVSVIDTGSMIEIARIPLPAPAGHGDMVLSGGTAYVSNPSGAVFVVDQSGVQKTVKVNTGAHEMSLVGGKLFVGSKWKRVVDIIDVASGSVSNTTSLPGNASFIEPTPDGKSLLVGLYDQASVARLDPSSGALIATFATVEFPSACSFTPSGKLAYIGSGQGKNVFVNRMDNWTVQDRLPTGAADPKQHHPRALFASVNGFDIEVTASGDGSSWWVFEPHLNTHAVHSGGVVGANPIDVVII